MIAYPDTSFLCALYRKQDNTTYAIEHRASIQGALPVTAFILFEFRQSVRLQTFLHRKDVSKGYTEQEAVRMLEHFRSDIDSGLVSVAPVDLAKVISTAERLSAQHTTKEGHRGFDILHIATALELGAKLFLTFDSRQSILAKAVGLKVKP